MHRGQIGEVIQQSGGKIGALQCDPGDLLCVVPPGNCVLGDDQVSLDQQIAVIIQRPFTHFNFSLGHDLRLFRFLGTDGGHCSQ